MILQIQTNPVKLIRKTLWVIVKSLMRRQINSIIQMTTLVVIDRTPNPFGKSQTEHNKRFGRNDPLAKIAPIYPKLFVRPNYSLAKTSSFRQKYGSVDHQTLMMALILQKTVILMFKQVILQKTVISMFNQLRTRVNLKQKKILPKRP